MLRLPLLLESHTGIDITLVSIILQRQNCALIVWPSPLGNVRRCTIALEVGNGVQRSIDRELLVVDTKTVTVGIWVREQAGLQNWIRRRFDVGNEMRW